MTENSRKVSLFKHNFGMILFVLETRNRAGCCDVNLQGFITTNHSFVVNDLISRHRLSQADQIALWLQIVCCKSPANHTGQNDHKAAATPNLAVK